MKVDVSKHRAWIEAAVAAGEFDTVEEAVDAALAHVEYERTHSEEALTGLDAGRLQAEVARGLASPSEDWEGADAFISRMKRSDA